MSPKTKKKTKAQLKQEVLALKAQLASTCHFASIGIEKASSEYMRGSAVIISVNALGGKEIMMPIAISDGLSDATIDAIKADIVRSYKHSTEFKPRGM
jgi:hypothetical protein